MCSYYFVDIWRVKLHIMQSISLWQYQEKKLAQDSTGKRGLFQRQHLHFTVGYWRGAIMQCNIYLLKLVLIFQNLCKMHVDYVSDLSLFPHLDISIESRYLNYLVFTLIQL